MTLKTWNFAVKPGIIRKKLGNSKIILLWPSCYSSGSGKK